MAVRVVLTAAALAASAIVLGAASPLAQSCDPPAAIDLVTGASGSDVVGVVEYEVIASNSSGFGASVGAIRRIWGGVIADRWMVVPAGDDCPVTPVTAVGERWYLLVGPTSQSDGPVFGVPSGDGLSDLEAGALASIVGEPVQIEIATLDRSMAWMRVNWWLIGLGIVLVIPVVAVLVRRRSGRRRDYLF